MSEKVELGTVKTDVPARLDRLPWARFHWMVVVGLGSVWILDGLEVTMVGNVAARMTEEGSGIDMTAGQIGTAGAIYVLGACVGAIVFGQLTDRFGRRKLFLITLVLYLVATVATAFSFSAWYFFLVRFSPVPASAGNTRPSTRPSTNSSPPACGAASTSSSTAPTGSVPPVVRQRPCSSSTPISCRR